MTPTTDGAMDALNELDDAVEKLWMTTSLLADRIDQILVPAAGDEIAQPNRQGDTVLTARILAITDRINRMTVNVAQTTGRVRL